MIDNSFDTFKLDNPLELKGTIPEDRAIFYDLARERVEYQSREENRSWRKQIGSDGETTATYIVGADNAIAENGEVGRFVHTLRIVVNRGIFEDYSKHIGEDCMYLLPYVLEHDIYEAWLSAKKGVGQNLSVEKKHLLARRREFYLATQDGLADKLYKFHMAINPGIEDECKNAMEYARRRIGNPDVRGRES